MSEQHIPVIELSGRRPILVIGLGFFMIVLVMGSLVFYGLNKLQVMHGDLEGILLQHNTKIEQVQVMRHIVRERMIGMHQLVIEEDPFKRDEIIMRFHVLANQFVTARDKLEKISQASDEKAMYGRLRQLTAWATPYHEKVVDLLSRDELPQARQLLREESMPAQVKVMEQADNILEYYSRQAEEVEKKAHAAHDRNRFIMIMLSGLATSISFVTALTVLGRVKEDREALRQANDSLKEDREALRQARDHLEEQVVERTRELSQTSSQLAEAQRIAQIGHFDWEPPDGELYWSDEVYRIFGLPKEGGASREAFMNIVHPDDKQIVEARVNQALFERVPYKIDHRIVMQDGAVRSVHQQGEVSYDSDGKPVRMLGTIQDITQRKEAEVKLQIAAYVFENAGEGVMITDADNNIIDVNEAFTEISGFKREDVLGKNPRLFKSGKHDPSFYREMWNTLLETGQWQGEIWSKRKSGAIYPKWQTINAVYDENRRVAFYIALFRDISEAKKNEEQLWKLAHFDNLTGVANRSLMYTNLRLALAQAIQENSQVAMMLFDLDGFKQINDTMGHDAGDQLLKHVARQLAETVRDVDTVARLGGDEFTVILTGIHKPEDVAHVAKKIQVALAQPLNIKSGQEIIARASIGIALYPADAADIETLMKNADRAMYHAKELGKNNFQFFAEGMSDETKPESPTA